MTLALPTCCSRRTPRADERRRHLLDTARTLFANNGFHRTGMAQIATASGIKVGQIYRDFASKEDIIAAIASEDVEAWLQEDCVRAAIARDDHQAIRDWINRFYACDEPVEECRMMTEIMAEAARNPRVADIYREIDNRIRCSLHAAFEALGVDCVGIVDRDVLVDLVLALGLGSMMRRIVQPEIDCQKLAGSFRALIDTQLATRTEDVLTSA